MRENVGTYNQPTRDSIYDVHEVSHVKCRAKYVSAEKKTLVTQGTHLPPTISNGNCITLSFDSHDNGTVENHKALYISELTFSVIMTIDKN